MHGPTLSNAISYSSCAYHNFHSIYEIFTPLMEVEKSVGPSAQIEKWGIPFRRDADHNSRRVGVVVVVVVVLIHTCQNGLHIWREVVQG